MNQQEANVMTEQEYRCPNDGKLLGKVQLIGDMVIVQTWCKNCKRLVDVVVRREEAPAHQ